MKRVLCLVMSLVMLLSISVNAKQQEVNNLVVNVLVDNDDVRIVESYDSTEKSVATYDKTTGKVSIETTQLVGRKAKEVTEVNFDSKKVNFETSSNEINTKLVLEEDGKIANQESQSQLSSTYATRAYNSVGSSSASTQFGNYGYFNIWSVARIKAGDGRGLIQMYADDVATGCPSEGNYNKFCDAVDDIRQCEYVGETAVGAEVLGTIVALIFAPDITATKLAAALGAIGIAGTLIVTFITWHFAASTARKYYDKLETISF